MDWIRYRVEDAKATQAKDLALYIRPGEYDPSLDAVLESIGDMDWLESLELGNWPITRLPRSFARLQKLRSLSLSECPNLRLGEELAAFPALTELRLHGLSPTECAIPWAELQRLTSLSLYQNEGLVFPAAILALPHLRQLRTDMPPPVDMAGMAALRELSLSTDTAGIPSLPPHLSSLKMWGYQPSMAAVIASLPLTELTLGGVEGNFTLPGLHQGLKSLCLFGRGPDQLWTNPGDLARYPGLSSLQLYSMSVQAPVPWERLPLQVLSISRGKNWQVERLLAAQPPLKKLSLRYITPVSLPPDLGERFPALKVLDLTRSVAVPLPPSLSRLSGLEELSLGHCEVPLPPLGTFKNLRSLTLPSTVTTLPTSILDLGDLKNLDLSSTHIDTLPVDINRLSNLETLWLPPTIRRIPPTLAGMRKLSYVYFQDNQLEEPPPEIAKRGWAAVQRYFAALEERGSRRLYEAKLIVVGEGEVGKTCLIRKLADPGTDITAETVAAQIKSTEGIDIRGWAITTAKSDDFRVNIWDFGGQEIYHATHQFFLTQRSLYLFVWDARKEDRNAGFEYWLNVVNTLSGGSPVLVVLNKCDERIKTIDEQRLRKRFPNIAGFFQVSALTGAGMDTLRTAVCQQMDTLPHVGTPWPPHWQRVRQRLEANPADWMSIGAYQSLCREEGVPDDTSETLLGFLHDLGVVLHFADEPLLRHTVILKPEWGTDAVYAVLDTQAVQMAHGRFSRQDLNAIWDPQRHPKEKHAELLALMGRFELCFGLEGTADYIAAELLSPSPPPFNWTDHGALLFEYHYDFMPAGIMSRFICRTHTMTEGQTYWKTGVVLTWEGARARIEELEGSPRRVRIAVQGRDNGRPLLEIVRSHFKHIHMTLNDLRPRQMVPCRCSECRISADPHFFDYETVKGALGKTDTLQCQKSYGPVAVRELLSLISDDEAERQHHWPPRDREERLPPRSAARPVPAKAAEVAPPAVPRHSGWFYLLLFVVVAAVAVGSVYWLGPFEAAGALGITVVIVLVLALLRMRTDNVIKDKLFLQGLGIARKLLPRISFKRESTEESSM